MMCSHDKRSFAFSLRDAPEVCPNVPRLEIRGRRECRVRAAPAVSCAKCNKEDAHEHTGQRRQSDIPCAMVLRLMLRSPRRRVRFVTVICGLKAHRSPVGLDETSADLTSATDARTTQFCRTGLRRSSCVPDIAHGEQSALRFHGTPDAARVHRILSRVRDDRDTPLMWDETAADIELIWVFGKSEYFLLWDLTGQITPNLARRARFFVGRCPPAGEEFDTSGKSPAFVDHRRGLRVECKLKRFPLPMLHTSSGIA
jgi:hypothetical protein